jgi:cytochrome c biogenesis protein ResB
VLDFLGFTDIYTSPITLVFLTLFYINLLLVVANRVPLVIKKALLRDRDEATAFTLDDLKRSGRCRELIIAAGDQKEAGNRIRSFFQNRAWSLRQTETGDKTLAVRNRLSAVGFLLFHLSFLLCLTGGLTIYYTRFSGRIALTEGEAFEGNLGQFYLIDRRPRVLRELPSLSFRLEKAVYEYEERQPSRLEAVLSIRSDDTGTTERIGVNQPVERGAYTILAVNAGVSPLFIIREAKTGADRDGAWVRLDATEDQEDMFRFDILGDLDLYAKFFPDYVVEKGVERTMSLNIRNPAFRISARQGDRVITEKTVKRGERMVIGPYVLEFRDLRRWIAFQVVREMGAGPLVAGFALAVVGLILRLIFYRREIRIVQNGERMWIDGTSEYYQHSFTDELDQLTDTLCRYVREGRKNRRRL